MKKLYTVSKNETGSWLWSNYELLIARFRLKLKKAGKTTRQSRSDLNHISYNYTVEVTNRFKGLDLIDRVPEEIWTEVHDIVGGGDQDYPQEKERQKGKMVIWAALQMAEKRREVKDKGKKERYIHLNASSKE